MLPAEIYTKKLLVAWTALGLAKNSSGLYTFRYLIFLAHPVYASSEEEFSSDNEEERRPFGLDEGKNINIILIAPVISPEIGSL